MDKKSNHPHDDFSVEEILQEARRLREQQGEEAAPATEADVPPAPQRAQAVPVLRTEMPAPSPVREPERQAPPRKEAEPVRKMEEPRMPAPQRERMEAEEPQDWEPEEEEPVKLSWAERRAEKKRVKEERRRMKRQEKGFEEEDDIYYGLQLKPLEEYKAQYERTLQPDKPAGASAADPQKTQAKPVQSARPTDKTGSIFSYLFDSTDEEMDEEIAKRFEDLHQERQQRMEAVSRKTGAFKLNSNTIEIKFPQRTPEPLQNVSEAASSETVELPTAQKKAAEPKPREAPKQQTPTSIWNDFPVGDETFEFPAMGSFTGPAKAKRDTKSGGQVMDLTAEGETFEFPAVGGYAMPPQIEDTNPFEPVREEEPVQPVQPKQPAQPKTPSKPTAPQKEIPAAEPAPEAPVQPQEPAAPHSMPEIPARPEVQPSVTPISAQEPEQTAPADTYAELEVPLRPVSGGRVKKAEYRPAGVTPIHVVQLHDYAEVILKEAKTYPKPAKLRPVAKPEEKQAEPEKAQARPVQAEPLEEEPVKLWEGFAEEPEEEMPPEPSYREPEEELPAPEQKKKKKFSIMGEEEPDNDPQETYTEEEPDELDDYQSPSDAPSVSHELGSSLRELTLRLTVTGICTILLLIFGVLGEMNGFLPEMLRGLIPTQTYLILNLVFLGITALTCSVTIFNGIKALFKLQANSDSGVAVAVLASLIQGAALLFAPESVSSSNMHVYAVLAAVALFLNTAGKFSLVKRVRHNFRFVASPDQKYAVQYFEDHNTALQMAKGCVADTPAIAYQGKTGFLKHFLSLSYENDPSDNSSQIIAPLGFILSLVLCIVCYFLQKDVIGAITVFAASACISVPMTNMLCVNLPLARLNKVATRCGAMVVGYPAVDQFSTANAVMVDAKDLFPKGTVILNGIKTFGGQRIDDAIVDATALMCATGGPLSDLFDQIIKSHQDMLPKIDNIAYEDDRGVVGWVSGRRILVGNRELMKSHSIEPPSKDYEEKYLLGGKQVVYLASGGDLVAMFIVSYNSDRRRAAELRRMEDNGISLIVRTCDPNVTPRLIAQVFDLDEHSVRVLPERLGKVYVDLVKEPEERTDALMATKGRPTAMMRMLTACVRQRSNISVAVALQTVAVVLGFLLVAFLACYSGLKQLSTVALLLFELFWIVAVLLVPRLRKP